MKNVFNASNDRNNKVNRNPYDKSFQNNLTFNIGDLVPAFVELVPPGGSVELEPTFGLQFMPMVFPVQTRMRAQLSYFKVPLRTLWSDYKDFISNFKTGLIPPYLNISSEEALKQVASTGSLGDYMGLPTTMSGSYGNFESNGCYGAHSNGSKVYLDNAEVASILTFNTPANFLLSDGPSEIVLKLQSMSYPSFTDSQLNTTRPWQCFLGELPGSLQWDGSKYVFRFTCAHLSGTVPTIDTIKNNLLLSFYTEDQKLARCSYASDISVILEDSIYTITFEYKEELPDIKYFALFMKGKDDAGFANGLITYPTSSRPTTTSSFNWFTSQALQVSGFTSELTLPTSPYYNGASLKKEKQLKISALPFRAYQSIYNAFYRDNRNNPLVINGQVEYNKWIVSDTGGAVNPVTENLKMYKKNWEQDQFTTAVQSPQQGIAPLVGITTYTTVNADGTMSRQLSITDESGDSYALKFNGDKKALTGVDYVPLDPSVEIQAAPNSLISLPQSGIAISDLRYVNAYQKYLEMNQRKGYSYKDIIEGHFDTNVRFSDLMIPEYIGGVSQDVSMNAITQTVETSQDGSYAGSLGSMAGNARVVGSPSGKIKCYCDEECYIIGIISVSPVPNYSQLLPKHFLHRELLDSFYPEFDNLGYQPITYKEICPIQAYNENPDNLEKTFGYNRPWYEYIYRNDEVHGLYRTNLRNFLINRVFDVKPTLSESFLLIDDKQVNEVFSVTESSHKIFGQIWHSFRSSLPISRVNIPKLD